MIRRKGQNSRSLLSGLRSGDRCALKKMDGISHTGDILREKKGPRTRKEFGKCMKCKFFLQPRSKKQAILWSHMKKRGEPILCTYCWGQKRKRVEAAKEAILRMRGNETES